MRPDLPSGTVTFLFTDVEGSTQLLHSLGAEGYAEALADHRRVIREACTSQDGVEVDTQGDGFFFAFPTAPSALTAAAAFTESLAETQIRVRVGIHTGTPLLTGEGYVGSDVHRAARIGAAGHGGQVLVSSSTAALVDEALVDLGEHRFKDLAAAERVFQVGVGGFPPLKSLYRTNLPVPATPFLGRERELAEVGELLARDDVRLLTLTGPGGTGKTRLALQAAAESADSYPDGLFWVPLSSLKDATAVWPHVAQTLDASVELREHISGRSMLLLLDNLEHLLPAASYIAELLGACPNLVVVTTSREALQLQAEHAYAVATLSDEDATELFHARARAAGVTSEGDVDGLCRRLDNLPLAIELAAARTRHLTIAQLIERLSQRLDLLKAGRDVDPRQQTLRATIEWSYDLLDAAERELFTRLAVFAGGCTLDAAEQVCDADVETLGSLVDKSLVRRTGERYWMLTTIRELAAELLERSEQVETLRRQHATYFLRLGETLGLNMESIELVGAQRHSVAILEQSNFETAIDWAVGVDAELAAGLAFALENWWVTNDPAVGARRLRWLAERASGASPEARAKLERCLGNCVIRSGGDKADGVAHYRRSEELFAEAGNEQSAAIAGLRALFNTLPAEPDRARRVLDEALARARGLGLRTAEAQVLGTIAWVERADGDLERALELARTSARLAGSVGFTWAEHNELHQCAVIAAELGRIPEAESHALDALELATRMGDRLRTVTILALLARLAAQRPDIARAGRLWGAVEAENARAPIGGWAADGEREVLVRHVGENDEFDWARRAGSMDSLDDAVEFALGARSHA